MVPHAFAPLVVSLVELSFVASLQSIWLFVPLLTLPLPLLALHGSTLPFIIFCALRFVLSYSFFTPELENFISSTLFFLFKALLGEFVIAFFLFSIVIYISSLVLFTLVGVFCGFSF